MVAGLILRRSIDAPSVRSQVQIPRLFNTIEFGSS